ncbi:RICIN domain-containing protein [Lentzea sp. NPDC054927]
MIAFLGAALTLVGAVQPAGAEPVAALSENVDLMQVGAMGPTNRWLQNHNSWKCLLVQGGADHNPAVQSQCLDYADQKWDFVEKGYGRYQLVNRNSGKCLLIRGSDNEAPAVQFQCLDYVDQFWTFHYYGGVEGEWLWVRNVNSGKCLVVRGGSDGTQLVQFPCTEYLDQAWRLWPQ